ncbi:MAG: YeeE/YedE family protein [Gammaproteobacteria bacterium]|nr:YeeE/YedE family protein [Gammaproteobacteria bacterium]
MAIGHYIKFIVFGLLMGYIVARIGFADYSEVHRLFTLTDYRMLITFIAAVLVAMVGFIVFAHGKKLQKKPLHKGTIIGGVMFGTGWAVTGACPSIAVIQLGYGYMPAVITVLGILLGSWLYRIVHRRWFNWDTGACDS